MLSSNDIRKKFIKFFEERGHKHVRSSSLVPYNDPTLLFTNAGMNQFKDVFLGLEHRDYNRAVTSQKCVRAGGKHNDLETVGKTARHHTFFEMLGNFSFGDYFKKEAIDYCWTFLTEDLGLDEENLYITIYKDDDEAYELWHERTGFDESRIYRLGEKDNFWQMGDIGPCGPCSEVHIDRGAEYACDHEDGCALGVCDCDRWLEIWNLVFMQYNRDEEGTLHPLPRPSVDTGMGLERIASVIQHVDSNYETDLFVPLIQFVEELTGKNYKPDMTGFPFRVIADHARACTFLIADGVLPSNEGRGYVLRRILRRAVRLGKSLGLEEPFLYKLTPKIVELMGNTFSEIVDQEQFIINIIKQEEERFFVTLQDGLKRVESTIKKLQEDKVDVIPGEAAFLFYDTYGFPIDLTNDIAEEYHMKVDIEGFEEAMKRQREMSKQARDNVDVWELAKTVTAAFPDISETTFKGYETLNLDTEISGLLIDDEARDFGYDTSAYILLKETPFYAQGGGQVGDRGKIYGAKGVFIVHNTLKMPDGQYICEGYIDGRLDKNEPVKAEVDFAKRKATTRNHTATHLLHQALRETLGDHVHQAGSLVDENHLRFDFSAPEALSKETLQTVEDLVNNKILEALKVEAHIMTLDQAKDEGYIGLFGEKYGEEVRCINIEGFSKELCGGTHVANLGEIGLFKIRSESSVSAGVRRIEAITGLVSLEYMRQQEQLLDAVQAEVKANERENILARIAQEHEQITSLKEEVKQLKNQLNQDIVEASVDDIDQVGNYQIIAKEVDVNNREELRDLADKLRDRLEEGVVVLGAKGSENEVLLVCMLTPGPIREHLHAGHIIRDVAKIVDGKGGGRNDMAQAGGKDPSSLPQAMNAVKSIIESQL